MANCISNVNMHLEETISQKEVNNEYIQCDVSSPGPQENKV